MDCHPYRDVVGVDGRCRLVSLYDFGSDFLASKQIVYDTWCLFGPLAGPRDSGWSQVEKRM